MNNICLITIIGLFLGFISYREYLYQKEKKTLLDRLMAKDYKEYKVFEDNEKIKPKTDEEDKKERKIDWL